MIFSKRKIILAICMIIASTASASVEEARSCNLYDVEIRKEKGIYERVYFNAALSDGVCKCKFNKTECVSYDYWKQYSVMISYATVYNDKNSEFKQFDYDRYRNSSIEIFNKSGFHIATLFSFNLGFPELKCDGASYYKGTKVNNIRACDKIR